MRKARSQMMPPRQDASAPAPAQDATQTASGDGSPALMMNGDKVIVIVDPYSTGCVVAQEALKRGYKLVVVWTKGVGENKTHGECLFVFGENLFSLSRFDSDLQLQLQFICKTTAIRHTIHTSSPTLLFNNSPHSTTITLVCSSYVLC